MDMRRHGLDTSKCLIFCYLFSSFISADRLILHLFSTCQTGVTGPPTTVPTPVTTYTYSDPATLTKTISFLKRNGEIDTDWYKEFNGNAGAPTATPKPTTSEEWGTTIHVLDTCEWWWTATYTPRVGSPVPTWTSTVTQYASTTYTLALPTPTKTN